MRQWIASIAFWTTCLIGYPLSDFLYGIIYNIFSNLYTESEQWDAHYDQMEFLVEITLEICGWIDRSSKGGSWYYFCQKK